MPVTPDDMYQRFAAFQPVEAAKVVMQDTSKEVLDLNRKQLFDEGIDMQGAALERYAGSLGGNPSKLARDYYQEKTSKNPRTASNPSYDGKDTGATYDSLTLDFKSDTYSITPHTEYSYESYGEKPPAIPLTAWGLTQGSKDEYWNTTLQNGLVVALAEATGCTTS